MDVGWAAGALAAVAGVVGTLLSALLTQRAADRRRQREQEWAERVLDRRSEARELRSCYVALNTAVRHYLAALTDQLHALGHEEDLRSARLRLTAARDRHRDVYAQAQIWAPEQVLDIASDLGRDLGTVYGMVRRLDDGVPRPGDSPTAARESIDALWDRLREMRRRIRAEPGMSRANSGR
ncbi:hypothetical protein [Embleya sp. NPDC059237]|uniref:hypothetical protein n=1 Tax=Embleya sp. NPDC059237 TaxID=3346784 RepID=UPI00369C625E